MNEKELLIARALDKKRECADNSMITHSSFLSVEELSVVRTIEKQENQYVDTFYFGGYDDSERQIALFVPKFLQTEDISEYLKENEEDNPLCILRLKKDKFTALSHRDYLGAIMGLGIKREMTGDIKTCDSGADVFCLKSSAGYICENLKKTGRGSVEGEILTLDAFRQGQDKTEIRFASVSSLRLDNILSVAFNLSRSSALEFITAGAVYVNSSQCLKSDFRIKERDKVVLRGKGKVVIDEIIGESKKGRIHLNIKKYL